MTTERSSRPSMEALVESEDLGLDVLHPGGLDVTRELADLCRVAEGMSVLDVACGTGESACFLAREFGCRVTGVDISPLMVERARAKTAGSGLAVEFHVADALALPFGSDTFDAVVSECTTCLLDKEKAIREMARVATAGGCVGIHDICWRDDTPERLKRRLIEIEGEDPATLEGWKGLFEAAGLVDVITVDRSNLMSTWQAEIRRKLGIRGQTKVFLRVLAKWGLEGLVSVLESAEIFQSRHTGYGIIVGRKPQRGATPPDAPPSPGSP